MVEILILLLILILMQIIIPLSLLSWLWRSDMHSRIEYLLRITLIANYLVGITLAGLWVVVPFHRYLPFIYFGLFLVLAVVSLRSVRLRPWLSASRWARLRMGLHAVLAVFCVSFALYALSGRFPPHGERASLAFPLHNGLYYVASGGSNILLNLHQGALGSDELRGQSYALDLVKLNPLGVHVSGLLPSDLFRYAIFGDPVYSSCNGIVIQAESNLPDLSPPLTDWNHFVGNHVLLDCSGLWILLAHLRQGSVAVGQGDRVREGQLLGQVGNSGNTSGPHLHIHAQRPGRMEMPFSGDPVPMVFQGRYLVRNDLVR